MLGFSLRGVNRRKKTVVCAKHILKVYSREILNVQRGRPFLAFCSAKLTKVLVQWTFSSRVSRTKAVSKENDGIIIFGFCVVTIR